MDHVEAWVDECEAIRPGHTYNVAASLIDPVSGDEVAAAIRELTPKGRSKLHWYDDHRPVRRRQLAQAITDLAGVEHVVVVHRR